MVWNFDGLCLKQEYNLLWWFDPRTAISQYYVVKSVYLCFRSYVLSTNSKILHEFIATCCHKMHLLLRDDGKYGIKIESDGRQPPMLLTVIIFLNMSLDSFSPNLTNTGGILINRPSKTYFLMWQNIPSLTGGVAFLHISLSWWRRGTCHVHLVTLIS